MAEAMEDFMLGNEALNMLGQNPKKGAVLKQLAALNIEPVLTRNYGRGKMVFVRRKDVADVLVKIQQERAPKPQDLFVTADLRAAEAEARKAARETIERIEAKLDRLLAIWDK